MCMSEYAYGFQRGRAPEGMRQEFQYGRLRLRIHPSRIGTASDLTVRLMRRKVGDR